MFKKQLNNKTNKYQVQIGLNMKKLIVLLFVIVVLFPVVNAVCISPNENLEIKENSVFCYGKYGVPDGINIVSDNVVVDCNNSILVGDGTGSGILLNNKNNVVVKNCNISNYEVGIYLESTNNSVIDHNYLSKNKFGIALFNSLNNDVANNFLFENIDNAINYLPIPLQEKQPIKEVKKEQTITPYEIIEEVIKVKKPFLKEDEILKEVNLVFDKYFNIAQQNLEIKRTIFHNESERSTTIILHLKPKKILLNVTIYEKIPKCVSAYANQLLFETAGYEVVQSDPLILWTFARIDKEEEISYKAFNNIDEECKNLLLAFGIATGFEEFNEKKEIKSNEEIKISKYLPIFLIVIILVFASYFAYNWSRYK